MEDKDACIETANQIKKHGYNCAQTVLMTFAPKLGIDRVTAAKICCGFGSGIAGCGEICGVPVAMSCAVGLLSNGDPSDKSDVYMNGSELIRKFRHKHGNILCRELKASGKSCLELILDGVGILNEYIGAKK